MALQQTVQTVYGYSATNAYCRVEDLVGNNKTKTMKFTLRCYKDDSDKFAAIRVGEYEIPLVYDGTNAVEQAYAHLKTLPEFETAVDC